MTLRPHRREVLESVPQLQVLPKRPLVLRQGLTPVVQEVAEPRLEVAGNLLQVEEELLQQHP